MPVLAVLVRMAAFYTPQNIGCSPAKAHEVSKKFMFLAKTNPTTAWGFEKVETAIAVFLVSLISFYLNFFKRPYAV